MAQTRTTRNETKRLDALLGLPLDRFRRAIAALTPEELTALETRLAVQRVRNRWARGGFGIGRHQASPALGLLDRRETALWAEREARASAAPAPVQLVFPVAAEQETLPEVLEKHAA